MLIGLPASADQTSQSNSKAPTHETAQHPPPAATASNPPARANIYAYSCKRPENADQENLCIERRAAKASEKQATWAKATFLVGCAGTAAVIATLVFTAIAAKAAQTAAEATVASVEAAQRSAEAAEKAAHVERGWMFFDKMIQGQVTNATVDGIPNQNGHAIILNWCNGGRTPAIKVSLYVDHRIIDLSDDTPWFNVKIDNQSEAICGQGKTVSTNPIFIEDANLAPIKAHQKRLIIYSRVEYHDVFGITPKRISEFTASVDFNGMVINGNGQPIDNVVLGPLGPQNGCT